MTSRHTLVCLPPLNDPHDWADAIDEAIAPYPDDLYTWTAYGRYDTHLAVRPDVTPSDGSLVQSSRARQSRLPTCSGGRRDLLDFPAMRTHRAAQASRLHRAWTNATATLPPAVPLSSFHQRHPQDPGRALQEFRAQPQLQVLTDLDAPRSHRRKADTAALVALDHDGFVERTRQRAVPGDLLLTVDGTLHINPSFINADDDAETGSTRYLDLANRYLDELPPDHLVFSLDVRLAG
ncbi:hypothetical protein ACF065_32335 [Streptomyces sp. NPDC015232]|uniref:hypothetical protein n=1 Tax=unclassified Streptomyces TaxID=2593676 RepID=UPI0036F83F26